MRKASLGTIFFTVFLDLLGFGLVVPYLPGVARAHGASDLTATLLGATFSLMQLLFVPFWGHLSDRTGRRPILVWSIVASALGMFALGSATSLWMLFAARAFTGIATSNIAVAQAYIADVTAPEERSRGMGLIGASIGLGFIFGPVIGGLLESISPLARVGALPAYAACGLSALNLLLALVYLPESLPAAARRGARAGTGTDPGARTVTGTNTRAETRTDTDTDTSGAPVDASAVSSTAQPRAPSFFSLERFRIAFSFPGVALAAVVQFTAGASMAGLEQTFRLFTEDEFAMGVRGTGTVLGVVGVVLVLVQAVVLRRLARVWRERTLVRAGLLVQATAFAFIGASPRFAGHALLALYLSMALNAFGSGLVAPSLSAIVSRCCDARSQGVGLGVLQSAGATARVAGPALGGFLYGHVAHSAPYFAAALGMLAAALLSLRLHQPPPPEPARR